MARNGHAPSKKHVAWKLCCLQYLLLVVALWSDLSISSKHRDGKPKLDLEPKTQRHIALHPERSLGPSPSNH